MEAMHHLQLVLMPIAWVLTLLLGFSNMRRIRRQNWQAMSYMSPGLRIYIRVMWWLVGVGFVTSIAFLAIVLIVLPH